MASFRMDEFIGSQVCVEFPDGEIVAGEFDSSVGDFICIRGGDRRPYLINERYIKMVYLKPEAQTDDE